MKKEGSIQLEMKKPFPVTPQEYRDLQDELSKRAAENGLGLYDQIVLTLLVENIDRYVESKS